MPGKKTLLSLAGFDPSGGAGLILDLAVFRRLGFHGAGVMTALTFQNTRRVLGLRSLPRGDVEAQYRALRSDLPWSGLKVGMIGSPENLRFVSLVLAENKGLPRVIDPVLRSSSGTRLIEPKAVSRFLGSIKGRASVITPNMDEAAILSRHPVRGLDGMRRAARVIYEESGAACLVKGGHGRGPVIDLLHDGHRDRVFLHERLAADVHGTGCFLSAALLAYLAGGHALGRASELAIRLTVRAIERSSRPGRGRRIMDPAR
jgi:hydroxymethylpyrimidine kinase/phosphomethylpyrimidine kinase